MNARERPFACVVGPHQISGTVYIDSGTMVRDYAIILNVDKQATYSFKLTMTGLGATPLFKCRGFIVDDDRFILIADQPAKLLAAPDLFEFVIHKIVEFHGQPGTSNVSR